MTKASRYIIIKPSKSEKERRLEGNNIYKEVLRTHELLGTKEPTDLRNLIIQAKLKSYNNSLEE